MLVTLFGIVIEVREEQPLKASDPMLVTLSPIVTDVKEEQSLKASDPMLVTLSPMIYSVTCEPNIWEMLELYTYSLLTIASELIVTEVKEEQLRKAIAPMLVTLLGMVMEVREEHL